MKCGKIHNEPSPVDTDRSIQIIKDHKSLLDKFKNSNIHDLQSLIKDLMDGDEAIRAAVMEIGKNK